MSRIRKKVVLILILSIVTLFAVPVGVYALLNARSNEETNQFNGGYINAAVIENQREHENSDNNLEEYASLKNNSDRTAKVVSIRNIASGKNATSMYARVRFIPSIVSDDGSSILGGNIKLTYEFKEKTAWKMKKNTYYYTKAIDPGKESDILISSVTLNQDIPDGYHLELKVMVDSIVSRPTSLLSSTWGIQEDFSDLLPLK